MITIYDKAINTIKRLGYSPTYNLSRAIITDHINKKYNQLVRPTEVLFDIILWNTPICVYNLLKQSLSNQYNIDISTETLANMFGCGYYNISTKYRNEDIFKILHPYINRKLLNKFDTTLEILMSKVFDEEDNYFNKKKDTSNLVKEPLKYIGSKFEDFINKITELDVVLSGSIAIAVYGTIYRNSIKDFDFIVDSKYLENNILNTVTDEITTNNVVGKRRIAAEKYIKDNFINTDFYKQLYSVFGDNIIFKSAMIDRVSQYDCESKCCLTFIYKDIEFDLLFKDSVRSIQKPINNKIIKIQDINDAIYAKHLFCRPKDFVDLINFTPYEHYHNCGKCVVNYD